MERLQDNKRRRRRWGSYCRSSVIWRRRSRRTRVCPETPPDWALCDPVSPLLFLLVAFSLFLRQQQPRDTGFENAPTSSSERSDIECSERGREGGRGGGRRRRRAREREREGGGAALGARPGSARLAASAAVAARGSREAPRGPASARPHACRRGRGRAPGPKTAAPGAGLLWRRGYRPHPVAASLGQRGSACGAGIGDAPVKARPGAVGRVVFLAELRPRTESFCMQRILPSRVPVAHGEAPPRGSPPLSGEGPSSPLPRRPPKPGREPR